MTKSVVPIGLTVGIGSVLLLAWVSTGEPQVQSAEASTWCGASPGASDYCSSSKCGPCAEGEGDCDPGQCQAGLDCVEEGSVDHCRDLGAGCTLASPGASDYCSSSKCGPCAEGEGDCDAGQCAAGLECVEEGSVDRCRPRPECTVASPGASDYCSDEKCGPCLEGQGDCDPGQCEDGFDCIEEGTVDRCRPALPFDLEVYHDGEWQEVCCVDDVPEVGGDCEWSEYDRRLTDLTAARDIDCNEGAPQDCDCERPGSGEKLHGYYGGHPDQSLSRTNGGPLYPDYDKETCLVVKSDGSIATEYTGASCADFRMR